MDEEGWRERGRAPRLARATGKSASAARKWINGEAIPDPDALREVAAAVNQPASYLRFGDEPLAGHPVRYDVTNATQDAYVDIAIGTGPLGTSRPESGTGSAVAFARTELDELGVRPHECLVLYAPKDSAVLALRRGDMLLVHRPSKKLEDGGLYVFRAGGTDSIRLVEMNTDGSVTLHSDRGGAQGLPGERVPRNAIADLHVLGRIRRVRSDR